MGSNQMTFERYEKKYLLDEIQYKEFIKRTQGEGLSRTELRDNHHMQYLF